MGRGREEREKLSLRGAVKIGSPRGAGAGPGARPWEAVQPMQRQRGKFHLWPFLPQNSPSGSCWVGVSPACSPQPHCLPVPGAVWGQPGYRREKPRQTGAARLVFGLWVEMSWGADGFGTTGTHRSTAVLPNSPVAPCPGSRHRMSHVFPFWGLHTRATSSHVDLSLPQGPFWGEHRGALGPHFGARFWGRLSGGARRQELSLQSKHRRIARPGHPDSANPTQTLRVPACRSHGLLPPEAK